jgi:two-component system, cell cycle response regulator
MSNRYEQKYRIMDNEQILIVDDDSTTLEFLNKHLQSAGHKTLLAKNGLQAIDMLYEHRPTIVVCDWMMPKMDGLKFCQTIKSLQEDYFIYFIMLTVKSGKNEILEAFGEGIDDFLSKPFDPGELLARINVGIRMASLYNELSEKTKKTNKLNADLSNLNAKLKKTSITDALTGLFNRRQSMVKLKEMWNMAERYERIFSCAMIDVDHFKNVNDTYGHLVGDDVLRQVASILSESTRETDHVFRVGGEEFMILFPYTLANEAETYLERCRELVSSRSFLSPEQELSLTISIGVADYSEDMADPDELLRLVDKSLYVAKSQGRNRVVMDSVS